MDRALPTTARCVMIPAAILAAGASSRMGRPKALLPTGVAGETFLTRIVHILSDANVDDLLVVTGKDSAAIRAAVEVGLMPLRVIENPEPEAGQLSSLLMALRAVDHPGVRGMLVTLVDVPLVSADTVRAVLEAYRRSGAPVVRPVRGGRHGHPVVFDRSVFDELRSADPHIGAKAVVRAHQAAVVDVAVEDQGAFLDVDTQADYDRIIGRLSPTIGGHDPRR